MGAVTTRGEWRLRIEALRDRLQGLGRLKFARGPVTKRLRESEELHRMILSNMSDTVLMTTEEGIFVYVCPNVATIFEYSPEEVMEFGNIKNLLGEISVDPVELYSVGEVQNIEIDVTSKDGAKHSLLLNVKRVAIKGGTLLYTCRDITDRKRVERFLAESEEKYRTLLENLPQRIFYKDRDSVYVSCNTQYARDLGISPGDIVHKTDYDFFPKEMAEKYRADDARIMTSGQTEEIEEQYARRGQTAIIQTVKTTVRDDTGEVVGILGIFWDITERKRVEGELQRYRHHLEDLVKARTRELEASKEQLRHSERLASIGIFAAGIAHEINNPVGMMLLSAETARRFREESGADGIMDQALESIVSNAHRCGRIVRSILQFARQESSAKCATDINSVVKSMVKTISDYAHEMDVTIALNLADNLPQAVMNPTQIEQVLVNLVRNALQARASGVQIDIRTETTDQGVQVVVQDNGRGIPGEHLNHLFDPFFTTRQRQGGTGLGLSIAHGIVADHGGTIGIESQVGQGTTVRVALPREHVTVQGPC